METGTTARVISTSAPTTCPTSEGESPERLSGGAAHRATHPGSLPLFALRRPPAVQLARSAFRDALARTSSRLRYSMMEADHRPSAEGLSVGRGNDSSSRMRLSEIGTTARVVSTPAPATCPTSECGSPERLPNGAAHRATHHGPFPRFALRRKLAVSLARSAFRDALARTSSRLHVISSARHLVCAIR